MFYFSVCFALETIVLYPNKSMHLLFPLPVSKMESYFPGFLIDSHVLPLASGFQIANITWCESPFLQLKLCDYFAPLLAPALIL